MSYFDEYRITSPYGWRNDPFTGAKVFHTGIDLVKAHQSPIYAFVEGTVRHAKEGVTGSGFGGYGITVAIEDKYGCLHVYAHLDMAVVSVGQKVDRGQMIGRQGNTGKSTGSHLHYEIRKTSSPQYGWIADRPNNCYEPSEYLINYFEKERIAEGKSGFKDVPAGHWAETAIIKANKAGVIVGVSKDEFGLGQPVTREQLAVILDRLGLLEGSNQND